MTPDGWTLLVLAAGRGSRFGGPKQLEPLGPRGQFLSDYALRDAERSGATRAVFVIAPEHETAFRRHHGASDTALSITYVHQRLDDLPPGFSVPAGRTKPWGTTHAVLSARGVIDGPFVIVNADDFYGPEAIMAAEQFLSVRQPARLPVLAAIAYPLAETLSPNGPVSRAILQYDATDHLVTIEERREVSTASDDWVSMNCWACPRQTMEMFEPLFAEFLASHRDDTEVEWALPETIGVMVERGLGRVRVIRAGRGWLGVTHASDRDLVRERLKAVG
ncbi:MAG TPA: NTP transferase domain-containing protein [Gemmatimonadales bacterium]|nr:NTP transferase domain-containing protein [Gemmatimonadales bacterium]